MAEYVSQFNNMGGSQIDPKNLLAGIYASKSNETEGRSKSIAEQTDFCDKSANYAGVDPGNIEAYQEDEGFKGEWYWEDEKGLNPKPWRPELTRLVRDIEAGRINIVFVWRSERLVRDNGVGDALAKLFRKHGVKLVCGTQTIDLESSSGLYQFNIEAANNRRYRDQTSEDIKRAQDFRAVLGKFTRNPSCFGFRSKGKNSQAVDPIWEELAIANRIFRMFVCGEGERGPMGVTAIANKFMDEGIRIAVGAKGHKAKHPEKVYTAHITSILKNCMYVGRFRHRGQEYDCPALQIPARDGSGQLETAVPVALFEAAQEKLKLTDGPSKRSRSMEHMLSGIMVCGYCGRPLHVHIESINRDNSDPRPPSKWFICNHRRPPRYCKPYGMRMLQEDIVEEWVLTELAPLLMAEIEAMKTSASRESDVQMLADIESKMKVIQNKETATLVGMVGTLDKDQIARVAGQFKADREQLQRKADDIRARLNQQDATAPDLSAENLPKMPKSAIKDALRRAVQWIAISKEGIIVLTTWGTYIAATIKEIPKGTYFTAGTRTGINAPSAVAALRCQAWFPSPSDFIKGRRDFMGRRGEKLTDAEILPGIVDSVEEEYLPDIDFPDNTKEAAA